MQVSLAAEFDGIFVGYLMACAWYGEFGTLEPHAVLESFGVHPDLEKQGAGRALLEHLVTNLSGLGPTTLRTEVDWKDLELVGFFHRAGFLPAPRRCLDLIWPSHPPGARLSPRGTTWSEPP